VQEDRGHSTMVAAKILELAIELLLLLTPPPTAAATTKIWPH